MQVTVTKNDSLTDTGHSIPELLTLLHEGRKDVSGVYKPLHGNVHCRLVLGDNMISSTFMVLSSSDGKTYNIHGDQWPNLKWVKSNDTITFAN